MRRNTLRAKCFEIRGGEIIPGLPTRTPSTEVKLTIQNCPRHLDRVNHVYFENGVFKFNEHQGANTQMLAFLIEPLVLDFEGTVLAPGLNLWAGAEWEAQTPFWEHKPEESRGHRGAHHRSAGVELWALGPSDKLILIDSGARMRLLQCPHGTPELAPIPLSFFIDYVVQRGKAGRTHPAVMWARMNLEKLKCVADTTTRPLILSAIADLETKLQEFRNGR